MSNRTNPRRAASGRRSDRGSKKYGSSYGPKRSARHSPVRSSIMRGGIRS